MKNLIRNATLLSACALIVAGAAYAGAPSSANSTKPVGIRLVGTNGFGANAADNAGNVTFTIKDAVAVEDQHKPVVAIVCEEFTVHAHNVARHVGHSDMKVLVLPYPLEARPTEELEQIARDYYPHVLELLGVSA